ncbi:hypothetical protein D3C84_912650 [compost metagenome]
MGAHSRAVQQGDAVAQAAALGLVMEATQLIHMGGFHCRVQVAVLEVAVDAVPGDPGLDNLLAAPAQTPDKIVHFRAQRFVHLLAHRLVARQAAGDLAAIAAAGTPADLLGLYQGDLEAALSQFHRTGHTSETAADDDDVNTHLTL